MFYNVIALFLFTIDMGFKIYDATSFNEVRKRRLREYNDYILGYFLWKVEIIIHMISCKLT